MGLIPSCLWSLRIFPSLPGSRLTTRQSRCLKKNQNAPRPSEHPPVMGEKSSIAMLVQHSYNVMEKKYAKKRAMSPSSLEILPASDSELRPRRSSGARLAYTDPSGERQQAPSTPRWGESISLQRSLRRAIASSVHAAAVGSA